MTDGKLTRGTKSATVLLSPDELEQVARQRVIAALSIASQGSVDVFPDAFRARLVQVRQLINDAIAMADAAT